MSNLNSGRYPGHAGHPLISDVTVTFTLLSQPLYVKEILRLNGASMLLLPLTGPIGAARKTMYCAAFYTGGYFRGGRQHPPLLFAAVVVILASATSG